MKMFSKIISRSTKKNEDKTEKSDKEAKSETPVTQEKKPVSVLEAYGFAVGKHLGAGSYATVKEAYSAKHKSQVAVKIISKKKAPKDYISKFLPRELEVVMYLRHPSLVCFLQSIETNNRVYLIMELADNGDLLEVIKKLKHVEENQAGLWFHQLVNGVDYCHSKGVAHRDLKCENLLLDRNNHLKISDFGFARGGFHLLEGHDALSQTYCGSYAYAPPEILTGTPYNPMLADVWSMGVVLFTMVFGRLPYDDSNHKRLLKQVQSKVVFPANRDWVSSLCKDLLLKILTSTKHRVTIEKIREDPWFKKVAPVVLPGKSDEKMKQTTSKQTPPEKRKSSEYKVGERQKSVKTK